MVSSENRAEPVITWPNHWERVGSRLTLHWQVNHPTGLTGQLLELRQRARGASAWEQIHPLTGESGAHELVLPTPGMHHLELGVVREDILKPRHRIDLWQVPHGITEWTSTADRLTAMRADASPRVTRIISWLESNIDLHELDRLERSYSTTTLQWRKYFDLQTGIHRQLRHLANFSLLRGQRQLRVVDIGSGAGHLLLIARILGHEAIGIDLPDPIFDDLNRLFGNTRLTEPILPQKPFLPSGERFDLINGVDASFHDPPREVRTTRGDESGMWSREDWIWFIRHVRTHLTDDGLAVLKLNDKDYRTGLHPGSDAFSALMAEHAVAVEGRTIVIRCESSP